MSFSNTPEQTRTKATRSRCLRFMFAWILKTNPEKPGATGETTAPVSVARGCGAGASVSSASRIASRPKLSSALPKNTGVCRPARYSVLVERGAGAGDERGVVDQRLVQALAQQLDQPGIGGVGGVHRGAVAAAGHLLVEAGLLRDQVEHAAEAVAAADRPVAARVAWMPSTSSISCSRSNGSRPGRSSLLTKVMSGRWRRRTTSKSFLVCASMPLAASITITALSTA